jgi:carbon monoxide dehydrogenase subunit G
MPSETFDRKISVPVGRDVAWRVITDVPTLVGWVSLLREAQTISELDKYRATLQDKIGMFALKADLDITVVEHVEPNHIVVHAEGEDRQVASRIVVDATVRLADEGAGSQVHVTGSYEVSGRVATLGAGAIKKKAGRILDEFFGSLERELV